MESDIPSAAADDGQALAAPEPVPSRIAMQAREQRHRRRVRFDPERRVIGVSGYALHLDAAANAVELLDWLIDVTHRVNPQRVRDIIDELDDACHMVFGESLQGVYCPQGEARLVDWRHRVILPARLQAMEDGIMTSARGLFSGKMTMQTDAP